jgi:16S rRNA (adenine1518-N6/adenine1519-N6)-dimethyltransferase
VPRHGGLPDAVAGVTDDGPALLGPSRVRELLAAHDLRPHRSMGQNYLADPNSARKVARLGGAAPGVTVLEVGPGLGSLTLALRAAGAEVVAIELDDRLVPALEEVLAGDPGVRIVVGDAMKADLAEVAPDATELVANLPYNIAAPLVIRVLTGFPHLAGLTVMVQREVGERIAAGPGTDPYGAVSVKVAALADAKVVSPISRRVFVPEPNVDSVVISVRRRPHPALAGLAYAAFARVVEAAFAQRRKTLRKALTSLGLPPAAVEAACVAAGIDPSERAERLGVDEFAALTRSLPG